MFVTLHLELDNPSVVKNVRISESVLFAQLSQSTQCQPRYRPQNPRQLCRLSCWLFDSHCHGSGVKRLTGGKSKQKCRQNRFHLLHFLRNLRLWKPVLKTAAPGRLSEIDGNDFQPRCFRWCYEAKSWWFEGPHGGGLLVTKERSSLSWEGTFECEMWP